MKPKPEKLILDMTNSQYKKLVEWLLENGVDLSGNIDFGLLGDPRMDCRKIGVALLNKKKVLKLNKVLKEIL